MKPCANESNLVAHVDDRLISPEYEAASWVAVVPSRTPPPVLTKLRAELSKVLKAVGIEKRLTELGSTAGTADESELRKFLKDETAKWAEVIRASGANEQ